MSNLNTWLAKFRHTDEVKNLYCSLLMCVCWSACKDMCPTGMWRNLSPERHANSRQDSAVSAYWTQFLLEKTVFSFSLTPFFLFFFLYTHLLILRGCVARMYVHECICACSGATASLWWPQDNLQGVALSIHYVGSGDQTRAPGLAASAFTFWSPLFWLTLVFLFLSCGRHPFPTGVSGLLIPPRWPEPEAHLPRDGINFFLAMHIRFEMKQAW